MQKKTKRKLNKKRFFGLLLFLAIGAIFITYLLNLKVSNVLITGTSLVSDATIIRKTNLRDYPYYKDIKKKDLENEISAIPLIAKTKITKGLNGTIKIMVNEEMPLMYFENTNKIITSENNIYENVKINKTTMPTLKTSLSRETLELLVKALKKLDNNILNMISEIEYSPTISTEGKTIDDKRFTFYMNDGNIAYINTINIDKFNNYLAVVSKAIDTYGAGVVGTFNFDSGTSNVVFQKKDSGSSETQNEL